MRAGRYDFSLGLYSLAGFRLERYRRLTMEALGLTSGDTVVDLACGTGLNFSYLQKAVGETGRIIGVDMTEAMLDRARQRVAQHRWENVELIQLDVAQYPFPQEVATIVSTYAITLLPEYDDVIRRGPRALRPGGRLAVLDFKKPEHWPEWLIRFGAWAFSPYGVSLDLAVRHPWESIDRYLKRVAYREFYLGGLYLCVGESASRLAENS